MATEAEILSSIGITDPAAQNAIISGNARLLILDSSAHLDWDWLLPFPALASGGSGQRASWYWTSAGPDSTPQGQGPASQIFTMAGQYMAGDAAYHYSICEMGFLRAFADADPQTFQPLMRSAGLRIAGGAITSPDNLISHGEAFIRAYLMGHLWLQGQSGPPSSVTAWLPDDFGHDVNLPIVIQAMGLRAAGFARIPGAMSTGNPVNGQASLATQLTNGGIDFLWQAPDGSTILAHWLIGGYHQGAMVSPGTGVGGYLGLNANPSPTPYIYVPVMNDFMLPNADVATVAASSPTTWTNPDTGNDETVYLAAASFEDYAQLVQFHSQSLATSGFNPIPFWTGYYATRPALKILHQRATRTLMAAEVFTLIANLGAPNGWTSSLGTSASQAELFNDAWNQLVPSTHHDYITGTAIPDVYQREQLLLLREAAAQASWLCEDAMQAVAANISPSQGGPAVAVFNALGFARSGVVELSGSAVRNANLQLSGDGYQSTKDGGLLFYETAPAMGYTTAYLTGDRPAPPNPASVATDGSTYITLMNNQVITKLTPDENGIWGLTYLVLSGDNTDLIQSGKVANDLVFYQDGGNEYQFGVETGSWSLMNVSLSNPTWKIVENGPLRVHVITTATYTDAFVTIEYVREYILHAGESILRMRTSGAAPMFDAGNTGSSVLVQFPLAEGARAAVTHGTPHHWTANGMSDPYWNGITFLPTHHFVMPYAAGSRCAIYHSDVHAWGTNVQQGEPGDGVLYGCLWRNGNGSYFNWVADPGTYKPYGTDPETHVREYAIDVNPYAAATGIPLRASLAFASPLRGLVLEPITSALRDELSLVSCSDGAYVTVAKAGTMQQAAIVLRVYAPNASADDPASVTLTLDSRVKFASAAGITALEGPLAQPIAVQVAGQKIAFLATTALTTIAIS